MAAAVEGQDVDAYLGGVWKDVKKDLRGNLGPEEARVLETISVRGGLGGWGGGGRGGRGGWGGKGPLRQSM